MKTYLVLKQLYSERARRTFKPGELIVLSEASAAILTGRGCVQAWEGEAPRRGRKRRAADPELDKLTDNDL